MDGWTDGRTDFGTKLPFCSKEKSGYNERESEKMVLKAFNRLLHERHLKNT